MAFQIAFRVSQSSDGKTLTVTDISDYSDIDINSFTSRIVVISDAEDNVLGQIDLGNDLSGTFAITADGYFVFSATFISNEPVTYLLTRNYIATQFYALLEMIYTKLITCGCGCTSKAESYANKALHCYTSSLFNFDIGQGISAQSDIDYANIFIKQSLK